jgi:zinc protease
MGVFGVLGRWRGTLSLLAALCCPHTAAADSPPSAGSAIAGNVTVVRRAPVHYRLENGLNVVLERDPAQPIVAVLVSYGAGSSYEPAGYRELAHLTEHMAFTGSRHVPNGGIYRELARAGAAAFNGVTTRDTAEYYAIVPARNAAVPLWLESDRMAFTLEQFANDAFTFERARVRKEILEREGSSFERYLQRALYPEDHPYRPSDDSAEAVDSLELSHAAWFFQKHYRPDNATLVMVGDFALPRARATVERYFGPVRNPPGRVSAPGAAQRTFRGRETLLVESWMMQGKLAMLWVAPPRTSADWLALALMAEMLDGEGELSLSRALLGRGLADATSTSLETERLSSFFRIDVKQRNGAGLGAIERAVGAVIERLQRVDDVSRSLPEARAAMVRRELWQNEDYLFRAQRHAEDLRVFGKLISRAERLDALRAVTPAQIAAAARRYLTAGRRFTARHVHDPEVRTREGVASHEVDQ